MTLTASKYQWSPPVLMIIRGSLWIIATKLILYFVLTSEANLGSAPLPRSNSTISKFPFSVAHINGVHPYYIIYHAELSWINLIKIVDLEILWDFYIYLVWFPGIDITLLAFKYVLYTFQIVISSCSDKILEKVILFHHGNHVVCSVLVIIKCKLTDVHCW